MRVLVDFTGPMATDGGGATYPKYLLPQWAASDDHVIAAFSEGQVPGALHELDGLQIVELPRLAAGRGQKVVDLQAGLPRVARTEAHDVAFFPGNFVPFAPLPRPSVVSIRSLLYYHYPSQVARGKRAYRKAATWHSVRAASRILVPTSHTADDLMRLLGVPRRKLVVVPHGVDHERFSPDGPVADVGSAGPVFLFVSAPWDYKGVTTVLRAFAQAQRTVGGQLLIADGGMPASLGDGFRQLADRLDVSAHVEWLGRVDHDALPALYRCATAHVLPSSIESFGNSYLEAAACGCPSIAGAGHGIAESIGPVAIQVPEHSHRDIAEAMCSVAQETAFARARRSDEVVAWARRFTWHATLAEVRQVLREVAG